MVERLVYTFENDGNVIELENVVPKKYFKKAGRKGFGVAPTELVTVKGATGGSRWRRTRRGSRLITLPIRHVGDSRGPLEQQQRELIRLLQDDRTIPRLVATYPDGSRLWTEIHYQDGADPEYGSDTNGQDFADWAMTLFAPDPYWTSEDPVQYELLSSNTGRGLIKIPTPRLSQLKLSSSQTIGNITVENPGDVDAFPVWTIRGPGDSFTATRSDGQKFSYAAPIAAGDIVVINTKEKTVKSGTGANLYTSLGDAPKFFSIPRGGEIIKIEMAGTTSQSLVSMYFNPRWELIF